MSTELEKAYQRGYNAGRRRKAKDISDERRVAEANAFERRAFLAALPACIAVQGWKYGDAPIVNVADRTRLARDFAVEARRRFYP